MGAEYIRNTRRILVGVIAIVILAVSFNYIQTWRRRARIVRQAAQMLSSEMLRAAETIEYSEHENGVARFKVRAKKLLETRQGISHLEGIEAFDFNPDGSIRNHIRSRRAEYDADHKTALFAGDVRIEVGGGVRLMTDTLSYDLNSNIGVTDGRLQLQSEQASGTAHGIRYNHAEKTLEMSSNLDFVLVRPLRRKDGSVSEGKARVTAQRGFYSGRDRILRFQGQAQIDSASDTLSGETIVARFSEDNKRISSLLCLGQTRYESRADGTVRALTGDRIHFGIDSSSNTLETIQAEGHAGFFSQSPDAQEELQASEIHIKLDPAREIPRELRSQANVQFKMTRDSATTLASGENLEASFVSGTNHLESMRIWDRARLVGHGNSGETSDELSAEEIRMSFRARGNRNTLKDLRADRRVRWRTETRKNKERDQGSATRTLQAHTLTLLYAEADDYAERGNASGEVRLESDPRLDSKGAEIRRLDADRVEFQFYPKENRLRSFDAEGHIRVIYHEPENNGSEDAGMSFTTTSTNLQARINENDGSAETVSQWGSFRYEDSTKSASAARADYVAKTDTLLLQGSPRIADANATTTGERIEFDRKKRVLSVHRRVQSILQPAKESKESTPFSSSGRASPAVVTADLMQYWTEEGKAQYSGSVLLLSENSQLQCQRLELYDQGERVFAHEKVRHTMLRASEESKAETSANSTASSGPRKSKPSRAKVAGAQMRYLRTQNSIQYSGGVTFDSEDVHLESQSLDALLDEEGKQIIQAAARGGVILQQGPREARGLMADYFFHPERFVVVGNPAEIKDPGRGFSRARRLTFFPADDRILLENR